MAGELIAENGNIILAAHKMEAYIPIELFDEDRSTTDVTHAAVASTYGEGFRVIAIFSVRIATTENDDISKAPLKTYNYPQLIKAYANKGKAEQEKARLDLIEENLRKRRDECIYCPIHRLTKRNFKK